MSRGEITLVLGGARSGKSRYAQELVSEMETDHPGAVVYVATAGILDEEMAHRVALHRADRPSRWTTLEAQDHVAERLRELEPRSLVLLDCLTMMISNSMLSRSVDWEKLSRTDRKIEEKAVLAEVDRLVGTIQERALRAVVVSNQVGQGIVPISALGRAFRDISGWANQHLARDAHRVYLLTAGIPQLIKGGR
ncbi:MAG: bifunctional adenosylcobinamide kinase/adenosylcobinamide-phosphate guanylyltransferase [Dethiosulfovibrio peptidovorans]|nr:MAG: bifunctional adenosylcobinamide kinase/adenosylcobinamide-phosphate guanylyltransferase [Dethiosulfovibrio peptidovorans]